MAEDNSTARVSAAQSGAGLAVAERQVLELAIRDVPLEDSLGSLIASVEAHSPAGVLASILLLDRSGKYLLHGAAPSLPREYCEAIHGLAIGPRAGSCGTAAYRGETIAVRDIANDPLWADFRDLALPHGLKSCWSTPIRSASGELLGTFAMYYGEPRDPAPEDLAIVDMVTSSAALIIDR
jgi:GAF domain-containing protein